MSTLLTILATVLVFGVIVGVIYRQRLGQRRSLPLLPVIAGATTRKLTPEERNAVENYLESLNLTEQALTPTGSSKSPGTLTLTPESNTVYAVTRAITRYGLSTDDPNKWRYYLDSVEVHLPPFWEPYITDDNNVEFIPTETRPLVISLNGHSLVNANQDPAGYALERVTGTQASIRGEESEQIELLNIRQETREEHTLGRPDGLREGLLIGASFFFFFSCLVAPEMLIPWLAGGGILLLAAGLWGLFAPPAKNTLREIHCLRGTPKRWGLFGETDQEQLNNISLGIVDLVYPPHWQPFTHYDLGQKTDIDIYLDRRVVRQGRFLSLHEEVKNFPLQHWLRSLALCTASLLVLVMLLVWVPLDMPLKLTASWLKGAQTVEATSVEQLQKAGLKVGDTLKVSGTGMCNIHVPGTYSSRQSYPFIPFDCSQIIWNSARPLPVPESEMVNNATALTEAVSRQLHPQENDSRVNPQLRSAIQKSGMVLLDDFADIVLKTQALCTADDDCIRLKNALINLGNTKDWEALVKRASSGKLDGVNVLLRPVSAESLDNLVTSSTAPFFIRETNRAAQSLNSPAPGGFMIISEEGGELVDQPLPPMSLYDYPAHQQWGEFQRLAEMLMQTPFHAEGVVTSIRTDANGTEHVSLHRIPDSAGLWRYVSTTLLLLAMIISTLYNGMQTLRRWQRHRSRLAEIQQYYASCFNQQLIPSSEAPPLP